MPPRARGSARKGPVDLSPAPASAELVRGGEAQTPPLRLSAFHKAHKYDATGARWEAPPPARARWEGPPPAREQGEQG